ncbi:MAG: DUF4145 domain-containing protein [Duodenibacillus sp.]|nr:DUF4145 domain-containing protein [Duodenibacillus sp.]
MRTYADEYGRAHSAGFRAFANECEFYAPEQVCLWRCPHCKEMVLEVAGKISYPTGSGITAVDCMPEDAKKAFEEAQHIVNLSPRAACTMLRICIERMVNATEAKGGNLAAKIESLGLPPKMTKLAHACRLVGNDAVHNNVIDFSVGSKEAEAVSGALTRFANRIAEELFGMSDEADEWTAKIDAARAKKH